MIDEPRIGIAGLGEMGRHHARVLTRLEGIRFIGGADPAGDVHGALAGHPLFPSLEDLIEAGPDAVVLVTPAAEHEKCAIRLAEAGIHTLIEKPMANDLEAAIAIRNAFPDGGPIGAVGHIERFNPALQNMKRRLDARYLGNIFSISTKRAGPFPLRVNETGVVRDLAVHDIDIVQWLIAPFASLDAQIGRQIGTEREDLVEAIGRLEDDTIVSMSVNWLTPMKERTVTVLGEKGALVADLLTSDLSYYSNAAIPIEWDDMARLKGVSEGDMTRYAFPKPEPLQLEHEGFRDAILGQPGAQIVSFDDGIAVMEIAEALLQGRLRR